MLHYAVSVRAIGGGVVGLALCGVWVSLLTGTSALVAVLVTVPAAVLLIVSGALGLRVEKRPAVALGAPLVRWIALGAGIAGAVLSAFFVTPIGVIVAAAVALMAALAMIICTNVVTSARRVEQTQFAVFPPLE